MDSHRPDPTLYTCGRVHSLGREHSRGSMMRQASQSHRLTLTAAFPLEQTATLPSLHARLPTKLSNGASRPVCVCAALSHLLRISSCKTETSLWRRWCHRVRRRLRQLPGRRAARYHRWRNRPVSTDSKSASLLMCCCCELTSRLLYLPSTLRRLSLVKLTAESADMFVWLCLPQVHDGR